jgi:hypothetical protein
MNKKCIINQGAGIGDILWCQKIAYYFNNKGFDVIWPVDEPYNMISEYIDSPWCKFVKMFEDDYPFKEFWQNSNPIQKDNGDLYLPVAHTHRHQANSSIMHSKYTVFGIDWSDWKDYVRFVPNLEKTKKLEKIIGVPEGDYIFKNNTFSSPHVGLKHINIDLESNSLPVVELKMVDGFNLFDWIPIILNAKQVHTVDTGFCFILEVESKDQELFMYERQPNIFPHIQGIFNKFNMIDYNNEPHKVKII